VGGVSTGLSSGWKKKLQAVFCNVSRLGKLARVTTAFGPLLEADDDDDVVVDDDKEELKDPKSCWYPDESSLAACS